MRAHGVIDFFPLTEFAVEFFHLQRGKRVLVKLLGVGPVGAFDGAVAALHKIRCCPVVIIEPG